jgi:dipeptidase D
MANNLIIKKAASAGYESLPTVVLQAHLDMVCEKNASTRHDFLNDPIRIKRDGDRIYADGTTLGADDATGLAFAMCVLESKDIKHPALEVVLTSDEEAGMGGIRALDFKELAGRIVINLDCSDEGIVVGCSGVAEAQVTMKVEREPLGKDWMKKAIVISGLKGGHSGLDIAKERGNAGAIAARILSDLRKRFDMRICGIEGGGHTNAIMRECFLEIALEKKAEPEAALMLENWRGILKKEFKISDPAASLDFKDAGIGYEPLIASDTDRVIDALSLLPSGVVTMNMEVPGLPETSGNIGLVAMREESVEIRSLYRSALVSKKRMLLDRCARVARLVGGAFSVNSDSPEWEYKADSRLAALIKRLYRAAYGEELAVEVSHGANECGMFFKSFPDADIVCTGTKITGAHTPEESVLVSVIQKEWNMLRLTLEHMLEY